MKGKQTKPFSKANIYGQGISLQSILLYITSLVFILDTHKLPFWRQWIQQEHIMYLAWSLLHQCFSLLSLMGAPGLQDLVEQMRREVPRPIWVLNGLSSDCLPVMTLLPCDLAWLRALPWFHSPGSLHRVCFKAA